MARGVLDCGGNPAVAGADPALASRSENSPIRLCWNLWNLLHGIGISCHQSILFGHRNLLSPRHPVRSQADRQKISAPGCLSRVFWPRFLPVRHRGPVRASRLQLEKRPKNRGQASPAAFNSLHLFLRMRLTLVTGDANGTNPAILGSARWN